MLTNNEKKVLRLLMTAVDRDYSINQIANECNLSPNGAYKILKKLGKEEILKPRIIANIKSYRINIDNEKTVNILELALIPNIEGRTKHRFEDLIELKEITEACVLFGSYVQKKAYNDLDVLFILKKNHFKEYKRKLSFIKNIVPAKIHDVLQTKEDLRRNIIKKDKVILQILRTGIILWGQKMIVGVLKNVNKREIR